MMDKERLQKTIVSLNHIGNLKNVENKNSLIEVLSDECINHICEICFNVVNSEFEIKRGDMKIIKKIAPSIKKLADSDVNIQEKRKLLRNPQVGSGIFTLIASVLPFLISLIRKK